MECGLGGQPTRLRIFIPDIGNHPLGATLPRRAWVRLNRLHSSVEHFRSCLQKWGMASSAACECGAEEQPSTMLSSNVQYGLHGLTVLDDGTIE